MHVKVIREMKNQFLYQNKVKYDRALSKIGLILFHFHFLGDSGGPLYTWKDSTAYLIGVVSRGTGCAFFNHPGIFTRVSKYMRWIQRSIKSGNCQSGKKR